MDNATINQRLGELVVAAGGVPVASDAWAEPELLLERVDALVLNGGSDIAAASATARAARGHRRAEPAARRLRAAPRARRCSSESCPSSECAAACSS